MESDTNAMISFKKKQIFVDSDDNDEQKEM